MFSKPCPKVPPSPQYLWVFIQNGIEVDAKTKQKRARGRPKKNWMEGIRKAMNERNLKEGQWDDREHWSLGVGQRRKTFLNRYIYISI
jgi:hypothetical protein